MSAVPDPVQQPTLTVEEAATLLNLSKNSVYAAVKEGVIPSIRAGRRVLVPTAKLVDLLGLAQVDIRRNGDVSPAPPSPNEPSPAA